MGKKVISAGHICIDMTPVFPGNKKSQNVSELLIPGKLLHVNKAEVNTGGSVANTGLALKILGVDVQLMGKVGNDAFGGMIKQILEQYGADGLLIDNESSTSYTIVVAVPGIDRIFLHHPGANDTFGVADIKEEALEDAALFHLGYPPIMRKMYLNDGAELIEIYKKMKANEIATSLDMAAIDPNSEAGEANWGAILKGVLPYTDFFVPSFEELCFILDKERFERLNALGGDMTEHINMEEDVKPLADKLLELGCRIVLIKCGTAGMYYKTASKEKIAEITPKLELDVEQWADKEGIQPCFQAEIVRSGTGAGDTSIAAFLAAVLEGKSPEKCAALAAAEGACAVTTYDALSGLKSLKELEEKIQAGWPVRS